MKSILMVIAPVGYRDEEFRHPKEVFESEGLKVVVASKGVKVAKGKLGDSTPVDIDLSSAKADDYSAVVFVGGPGAEVYFDDESARRLAVSAYEKGKVIAAICIAPSILANAGLLEGRDCTSFSSEEENLVAAGGNYTGDPVTVDGKIVTADGPAAAKAFGRKIVALLN